MTTILSIQSSVAYGHVGNSAAVFPLQRLGVEVWPVHTVHFSNHTGYGQWRGPLMPPEDVREVVTGIEERGALTEVDAVLSGYQGGEQIGEVILDAVARTKAANPGAIYACDPVMGNATSGCFVHPAIPVLLRERVVPQADLVTPNQFELGFLTETDRATSTRRSSRSSRPAPWARARCSSTSVLRPDRPEGTIEMLAVHGDGAWIVQTPHLPLKANGSGDVTAALFTAHLLESGDAGVALGAPSPACSTSCSARTSPGGASCSSCRAKRRSRSRGCSSRCSRSADRGHFPRETLPSPEKATLADRGFAPSGGKLGASGGDRVRGRRGCRGG